MISTVTAITVSTIVSSSASSVTVIIGAGSVLALIAIVTLLVLLIEKEVVSVSQSPRAEALSVAVNVGLMPLLIAFGIIVAGKVGELVS